MAEKRQLSVTLVNRNYPPNKGITGAAAADFAKYLVANGVQVNVVTISNSAYAGGADISAADGRLYGVKTFYNGKNKALRLLASLVEGYQLMKTARNVDSDWTIVMTDPPLLNYFASRILSRGKKWVLWSMDVYPDAFIAAGLVQRNNPLLKGVVSTLKQYPPDAVIALGPVQERFLRQNYYETLPHFRMPCGVFTASPTTDMPAWKQDPNKIYLGYAGNIGEAHSVPFLKEIINRLDPSRFVLLLSLYGAKAEELKSYAEGKAGVMLFPSLTRAELSHLDIHLATLEEQWVNVCVPSKAVSSICAGATILYCGISDSDNWELLGDAGWRISPDGDIGAEVSSFFAQITSAQVREKRMLARQLASKLVSLERDTYERIYRFMAGNETEL